MKKIRLIDHLIMEQAYSPVLAEQIQNTIGFEFKKAYSDAEWMDVFVQYIEEMHRTDFNRLLALLYRVDVDEQKIKAALDEATPTSSMGYLFARLIIERLKEKLYFREKYKSKGKPSIF